MLDYCLATSRRMLTRDTTCLVGWGIAPRLKSITVVPFLAENVGGDPHNGDLLEVVFA